MQYLNSNYVYVARRTPHFSIFFSLSSSPYWAFQHFTTTLFLTFPFSNFHTSQMERKKISDCVQHISVVCRMLFYISSIVWHFDISSDKNDKYRHGGEIFFSSIPLAFDFCCCYYIFVWYVLLAIIRRRTYQNGQNMVPAFLFDRIMYIMYIQNIYLIVGAEFMFYGFLESKREKKKIIIFMLCRFVSEWLTSKSIIEKWIFSGCRLVIEKKKSLLNNFCLQKKKS